MKRRAVKTLAVLMALSMLTLSLPAFSAAETSSPLVNLNMGALIAEHPGLVMRNAALPKVTGPAQKILSPVSASMRQYSDFTVKVKVAPATMDALYDLCCCYSASNLTFQSASYTASVSYLTVSFSFQATGAPGSTNVKFYSSARRNVRDYTRIKIKPIPVASVSLDRERSDMAVGETAQLVATVLPENASNRSVRWKSSNSRVASVSPLGIVTAKRVGSATITAVTVSGNKHAACKVTVTKAVATPTPTPEPTATPDPSGGDTGDTTVYRALLIGNEMYSTRLQGPYNDLIAMGAALNRSSIGGGKYAGNIISLKDQTRSQILDDVAALANKGIDANDVTLFYYSGHGAQPSSTESGTGLVGVDSRLVSVTELKSALDKIPGKVIVILDSCFSGMFIGKSATSFTPDEESFNDAVTGAFAIQAKGLTSSQYHVITACRKNETSLSVGYYSGKTVTYVGLASYYLAVAGGYDLFNPSATALNCDKTPKDNIATFKEVFDFADYYVDQFRIGYDSPDVTQDMQYFSGDTSLPLFGRT